MQNWVSPLSNRQLIIFIVDVSWIFGCFIVLVLKLVKSIFNKSKNIISLFSLFFLVEIICPLNNDNFFLSTNPFWAITVVLVVLILSDDKLLRFLTVKVKKHDLNINYFEKKESWLYEKKER